jgi:branched-subunit amino acid transport protein
MARWEIVLVIVGMGLVTYFTRVGAFLALGNRELPRVVKVFLKYIPVAMLTAIIVPAIAMPREELFISLDNPYLVAGLASAGIAWLTKNVVYTVAVGLALVMLLGILM